MKIARFTDPKAKAWLKGLKTTVKPSKVPRIWVHSASLGEYNQAKPLISLLEESGYEFVFTFFSPSGFERVNTKYPKYYLPLDTRQNAHHFIEKINPSLAIFVRSEFWFNHISVLEQRNIPLVFINSFLHKDHYFFKWYGKWSLSKLKPTSFFYTTNEETSELLSSKGLTQNLNLGDTKVDQVLLRKRKPSLPINIPTDRKIILAASLEHNDRKVISKLLKIYNGQHLLIIVPHEHSQSTYDHYCNLADSKVVKLSEQDNTDTDVLYVDEFGILPLLYSQAWVSYIGGGFDNGIHNILESCVEGTPMIFGPKHHKFPEAKKLIELEAAISIDQPHEIISAVEHFKIEKNLDKATIACKEYLKNNQGASQKIYDHLKLNIITG